MRGLILCVYPSLPPISFFFLGGILTHKYEKDKENHEDYINLFSI